MAPGPRRSNTAISATWRKALSGKSVRAAMGRMACMARVMESGLGVTKVIAKKLFAAYPAFVKQTQSPQGVIVPRIDVEMCNACGWCAFLCPTRAVELVDGCAKITHPADCSFCGICEACCPEEAIQRPFSVEFSATF
jgi:heterodisulfide reductase subunit A-like polyferredoxin